MIAHLVPARACEPSASVNANHPVADHAAFQNGESDAVGELVVERVRLYRR